jgi:hypothetical protein
MHREVSARNIVLKSKTERVEQALYELNRQKIGAVGWKTIFSGNDTIVNNGGDYLIVFKRKDDSFQMIISWFSYPLFTESVPSIHANDTVSF